MLEAAATGDAVEEEAGVSSERDDTTKPDEDRTRPTVIEPEHLLCPVTRVLFRDPVFVPGSGNTYEREALDRYWATQRRARDPNTNLNLDSRVVYTNWDKRREVQSFLDGHPGYVPEGWSSREVPAAQAAPRAEGPGPGTWWQALHRAWEGHRLVPEGALVALVLCSVAAHLQPSSWGPLAPPTPGDGSGSGITVHVQEGQRRFDDFAHPPHWTTDPTYADDTMQEPYARIERWPEEGARSPAAEGEPRVPQASPPPGSGLQGGDHHAPPTASHRAEPGVPQLPHGSTVLVERHGDTLHVEIPTSAPSSETLALLAFGTVWTGITATWTANVIASGAPGTMVAFSTPFWAAGIHLYFQALHPLVARTSLHIGPDYFTLSHSLLRFPTRSHSGPSATLQPPRVTQSFVVNGVPHSCLQLADGTRTHSLGPYGGDVKAQELEYIRYQISQVLAEVRQAAPGAADPKPLQARL